MDVCVINFENKSFDKIHVSSMFHCHDVIQEYLNISEALYRQWHEPGTGFRIIKTTFRPFQLTQTFLNQYATQNNLSIINNAMENYDIKFDVN